MKRGVVGQPAGAPRGSVPHTSAHPAPDTQPSLADRVRALRRIYSALPSLECKGLCHTECMSGLDMSRAERSRIEAATGQTIPLTMFVNTRLPCPMLEDNRCGIYRLRPLICRIWGMVDNPRLRCPHGCTPDRWLTETETVELILDSFDAGTPPALDMPIDEIREILHEPGIAEALAPYIAGHAQPDDVTRAVLAVRGRPTGETP